MSKEKVRVGIIGCGGIANGKHMPSLSRLSNVEMVAFCDIVLDKAEKAATQYGIEGALVFEDYRKLLELKDIDVIHVCTPNFNHSQITVDALEAGKHVMCEKPMAKTYAEALKMVDAAKRTGKKLTIGYQNRQRADSWYLKKLCDEGGLGNIYFARAFAVRRRAVPTWGVFLDEEKQGGGPLIDIGTHALDLTLWFMNNYEWDSVMGVAYRKLADTENAANAWGPWDPKAFTVEDSAFGFIRFKNGATISLDAAWALNTLNVQEATCMLCGTAAGADFSDGLRLNGEKYSRLYVNKPDFNSGGVAFYEGVSEDPAHLEAARWINAILNDKTPVVLPEQALVVTQILEAIYTSSKTGQAVYNK